MKKNLAIIGLERPLAQTLSNLFDGYVLIHDCLPKYVVNNGQLFMEKSNGFGFVLIDIVVFHGIYEDDFDLITALNFWGGPCFPNAFGMMNCRLKLPCLARALRITNFGSARGMVCKDMTINAKNEQVAKWGNWHCGDNKEKFIGSWKSENFSILEPYFDGEAVRVVIIGDQKIQIRMTGHNWLKSVHHKDSRVEQLDNDLYLDSEKLKTHFGLQMIANDYIITQLGTKYLLEVNHIPNVTRFEELKTMYQTEVIKWLNQVNDGSQIQAH